MGSPGPPPFLHDLESRRSAHKRSTWIWLSAVFAVLVVGILCGAGLRTSLILTLVCVVAWRWHSNRKYGALQRDYNRGLKVGLETRLPGTLFERSAGMPVEQLRATEMMRTIELGYCSDGALAGNYAGQAFFLYDVHNPRHNSGGVLNDNSPIQDGFDGVLLQLPGLAPAAPRVLVLKKASLLGPGDHVGTGDAEFERYHWAACRDPATAARVLTPQMRAFLLRYFRPLAGVCRARFDETGCQFMITTFHPAFDMRKWSGPSAAQQVEERVAFVEKLLQDAVAAARSVAAPQ